MSVQRSQGNKKLLTFYLPLIIIIVFNMMEEATTIEIPAHRSLFKRGSFYDCFYQLISGSLIVTISQAAIEVTAPLMIGDYQIIEKIDYRVSNIKATTRCTLRAIPLSKYRNYSKYYDQIQRAFGKFQFKSRNLQYWLKKTFETHVAKRCEKINAQQSIGIVLDGLFKIDRNIPIVCMKQKKFQLLRKFQICQLGEGEIFEDMMVCQSTQGTVALCTQNYVKQLAKNFQQFQRVIQLNTLKDEVHSSLEKEIYKSCKKKSKLYQQMVPLPLKSEIKAEENELETPRKRTSTRLAPMSMDVFRLTNNISSFLHLQWKKGLSLNVKRKVFSPPHLNHKPNLIKLKRKAKDLEELTMFEQSRKKQLMNQEIKVNLLEKIHKPLSLIKSLRIKTEGDEKRFFKYSPKLK